MFKPILDIFRYIKMFQNYLGKRIYIIFALGLFASLSEGFGILMIMPLLETLDGSEVNPSDGFASNIMFNIINFFNFDNSPVTVLLIIAFAFCFKGLLSFAALSVNAILMGTLLRELKGRLFDHYTLMSYKYFSSKNTGHFTNLINEQSTKALDAFSQLTTLGGQVINTIVLMTLAFMLSWEFGSMAVGVGIILLLLFVKLSAWVRTLSRITASENGVLTKWLVQTLQAFKYLAATGQTKVLKTSISKSIAKLVKNQVGMSIAASFTQSVREPIAVLFIVCIVFIQIIIFEQTLEPILVSIVLFYRALNTVMGIQGAFQATYTLIGSMEIVDKEFQNQKANKVSIGKREAQTFSNEILLQNVTFAYNNEEKKIIKDMTIKFPVKKSIAIVGESGAGKSTLVDLITLIHQPDQGNIYIDDVNSTDIKKSSWRSQIGYVSQDTVIFDDTIKNNISMWNCKNITEGKLEVKVRDAARQANILEFIDNLPEGFESYVGDRGLLLSGGQKQRLFIARELFRNPNLLILDEATSALDSGSEKEIQKSIDNLKGQISVIIIAHRLSTIKNVDLIYVLKNGIIIESGTYQELATNEKSNFSNLIAMQSLEL
jgi:subfamily B ATP-binding cassette protein MsbA